LLETKLENIKLKQESITNKMELEHLIRTLNEAQNSVKNINEKVNR